MKNVKTKSSFFLLILYVSLSITVEQVVTLINTVLYIYIISCFYLLALTLNIPHPIVPLSTLTFETFCMLLQKVFSRKMFAFTPTHRSTSVYMHSVHLHWFSKVCTVSEMCCTYAGVYGLLWSRCSACVVVIDV